MYDVTAESIRALAFGITIPAGAEVDNQLRALIVEAAVILDSRVPGIPARLAAGDLELATVQSVVKRMVLRVARNPRALRSMAVDDFSATVDAVASTGELYVTDDEIASLMPAETSRGHIGSIRLGVPTWRLPRA